MRVLGGVGIVLTIIILIIIIGAVVIAPPDWTRYQDKEETNDEQDTDKQL